MGKAPNNISAARRAFAERTGVKYTQEDAARDFGVSLSTYRNYEQEVNLPNMGVAAAIARKFGVSIDYLLGQDDSPTRINTFTETLTVDELRLIDLYRDLSDSGKEELIAIASMFMNSTDEYRIVPLMLKKDENGNLYSELYTQKD